MAAGEATPRTPLRDVRNVVVEPTTYEQNLGDIAMLQVAVRRLAACWPAAIIHVVTQDADALRTWCPEARPLVLRTPARWRNLSTTARWAAGRVLGDRPVEVDGVPDEVAGAVAQADLVVISGGGGTTDEFPGDSARALNLLRRSALGGAMTAMVGQGFGPLGDTPLRDLAKIVLPGVDLIMTRDNVASPALLRSLGVDDDRVVHTGDDAILLAPRQPRAETPMRIGFNVRVAPYSGVDRSIATAVAERLLDTATALGADVLPLPVSLGDEDSDVDALCAALGQPVARPDSPEQLVAGASSCRVVVTGSYHPAVFALAQGVPAVGIANHPYYVQKFDGLRDLFGTGCALVVLDGGWERRLSEAIATAWHAAPVLEAPLLAATDDQCRLAEAAHVRLHRLVENRHRG